MDKVQRFKFGGDGDPVEASFAVTLPIQIGDAKTWIEAFVVPGSTPHLISRRWLSGIWFGSSCASLIWSFASVTCEFLKRVGPIHCHDRFSELFLKHLY